MDKPGGAVLLSVIRRREDRQELAMAAPGKLVERKREPVGIVLSPTQNPNCKNKGIRYAVLVQLQ